MRRNFIWIVLLAMGCGEESPKATNMVVDRGKYSAIVILPQDIPQFVAAPERFVGKSLLMKLIVSPRNSVGGAEISLQDFAGKPAWFVVKGTTAEILSELPQREEVREEVLDAKVGQEVQVTFYCTNGNLTVGNIGRLVEEPWPEER